MSSALHERYEKVVEFFNPPKELTPQNGLQSLRWLKYDMPVAMIMTAIAYVFALSISRIAHMTPVSGIESGILACFLIWLFSTIFRLSPRLFPDFRKGGWVLIAGPAAALAPILADAVDKLGRGNLAHGQLLVLPVIMTAGVAMFLVALFKLTRFTTMASKPNLKGSILAFIGFVIIVKQIPVFLGVKFHDGSVSGIFKEVPSHLGEINWLVFSLGAITLAILLFHELLSHKIEEKKPEGILGRIAQALPKRVQEIVTFLPAPFTATIAALVMGYLFTLHTDALVQLPNALFTEGFEPGIKGWKLLLADPTLWSDYGWSSFKLTMVDTIEICGTVLALDTLDRYHRRSNLNNILMAMAVANMAGGAQGTQSNIPGGMKSTSAWKMGAKTVMVAGLTGLFMYLVASYDVSRNVVQHMPIVSLGAVIAFVGWHLCAPSVWKQFRRPGKTLLQEFAMPKLFFVFVMGYALLLLVGEHLFGNFSPFYVSAGAILLFIGWHLCEPALKKQFRIPEITNKEKISMPGPFFLFVTGFLLSLVSGEILIGFFGAMIIEFMIYYRIIYLTAMLHKHNGVTTTSSFAILRKIFGNPVEEAGFKNDVFVVKLHGPVTTFNQRFVPECPEGAMEIFVDAEHPEVTYIDGNAEEYFSKERKRICGKPHFKVYNFTPACSSGRSGSGMVRDVKEIEGPKMMSSFL